MRLQKYIAQSGITSRRKAEELIIKGKIKINGRTVKELGTKVDTKKDIVTVGNEIIQLEKKQIYIMLNKPEGYITTLKSFHDDRIVMDLVKGIDERIFPVGRLDKDSSGLLLMTNDGTLANKLMHPKYEIIKEYSVLVKGIPSVGKLRRFKKGLRIDGKLTAGANIKIAKKYKDTCLLKIYIHEGRKRQVKKMCEYIGHPVIRLKRVAIGRIELGDLEVGTWRYLFPQELKYLKSL